MGIIDYYPANSINIHSQNKSLIQCCECTYIYIHSQHCLQVVQVYMHMYIVKPRAVIYLI